MTFEIQGSKVCSTIRPLFLGHCFGFFQGTHVWKAPTSTFHHSLVLPRTVASVSRSKGPKCARLSAPSLWATVFVSFKGAMYGKPHPIPFTTALFCHEWLHQFRDPRVESVLDYPPPHFGPRFWFLSKDPSMETPNQHHPGTTGDPDRKHALHHVAHCDTRAHGTRAPKPADLCSLSPLSLGSPRASPPPPGGPGEPCAVCYELGLSPEPCFARDGCMIFEIQGSKVCSTIRPLTLGHCFGFSSRDPCMESPTQHLSPQPCFARNGCINFEIQGSKVCSTIRPLTLRHCFGFLQGTHVWKSPPSTFHQSLVLPRMVASISRSKGLNCARLSAPSLWANALLSLKGSMYGKAQPLPFTKALFCQEWLHDCRDPRVESVLDYPPPNSGPLFRFLSSDPCIESPNQFL